MQAEHAKKIIGLIALPLILVGSYFLARFIWVMAGLPSGDAFIPSVLQKISEFGIWIIFFAALIEGFFVLGQYFPGGAIIFLGVISTQGDVGRAMQVVATVSIAFIISYALNYAVGRYGWYKLLIKFGFSNAIESAKQKLERHGLNAVFLSYWEPTLATMVATAAGILQFPFKQFQLYSICGVLLWNTFWGVVVFNLGKSAMELMGAKYVLIVFFIWAGIILIKYYVSKEKQKTPLFMNHK